VSSESEQQKALRLVREGATRLTRHRELIAELQAEGQSTTIAERILAEFEKIQSARLAELGKFAAKMSVATEEAVGSSKPAASE
jgi:hypothetical protein